MQLISCTYFIYDILVFSLFEPDKLYLVKVITLKYYHKSLGNH